MNQLSYFSLYNILWRIICVLKCSISDEYEWRNDIYISADVQSCKIVVHVLMNAIVELLVISGACLGNCSVHSSKTYACILVCEQILVLIFISTASSSWKIVLFVFFFLNGIHVLHLMPSSRSLWLWIQLPVKMF